jgi:glycosyl transferase/beta-hydroxylase protein BlmF
MGHFVKTSVAIETLFDETRNTGEDFDYYLRVWETHLCIKIPLPFFYNRRGLHSRGPKSATGREWRLAVTEIMNAYRYKQYIQDDILSSLPKKTISLLCPTRGRPDSVARFICSVMETATFPERVEILLYIDLDDGSIEQYRELLNSDTYPELSRLLRCEALWGEPIGISKSWNVLAAKCKGDLLCLSNDDQVYADKGWDVVIDMETRKFPDKIYCMWFNDGINGPNLCAFPIVSRTWYETLGYFTPDLFAYFYVDTWIMDIAKRVRRLHYIPHVFVEHMHFTQAKSGYDDTYKRNRPEGRISQERMLFESTAHKRQEEAVKLQTVIDRFKNDSPAGPNQCPKYPNP